MKNFQHILFIILLISNLSVLATPFESCPSKAFLIQQTTAKLYGVNLVTGSYDLLSGNLGTNDKINGFGFNFHDNYMYGWGYEWGTVVKIGSNLQAEPLTITNNPGVNFFVGDISLEENAYYVYKRGTGLGLYKISLDESNSEYLNTIKVIDSSQLNLSIFDFAFHPELPNAYSVDNQGRLFQINVNTGQATNLGNVGETGTFGAVYFDVDGNFYISRNNDGYIFRINVLASSPTAEFFAYGPSSSNNDGARCAIAPIVDESEPATTDFGDAPDSYGTTLFNNGARHGLSNLHLGSSVDGEYNASVYPGSDDQSGSDDEDGLIFITPLIAGLDSLVQISVKGGGYLNIWGDWDQNGTFEPDEKLLNDEYLSDSNKIHLLTTPLEAFGGSTWIRARISSTPGIVANGGVADGEVEDYRVTVINEGYSLIQHSPFYLAFEDNWPLQGDYDMNDVVIYQSSSLLLTPEGHVKQLEISGSLQAMGAGYPNGYAIQLDNISPDNVNNALIRFEINGVQQSSLIETGTDSMVLVIEKNLKRQVAIKSGCAFFRTESNCNQPIQMFFTLKVPFSTPIQSSNFPSAPFNPFIFGSPGLWHGDYSGRGLEIHLKNKMPTSKANTEWLGLSDDASQMSLGKTYQTSNGLPWALAISAGSGNEWHHPLERTDLIKAYPEFSSFTTSNGLTQSDWYKTTNASSAYVFDN